MINKNCKIGKNVVLKENVVIGNNVIIEDNVYIDYDVIIKDNVHIKSGTFIGCRSILGEFLYDFFADKKNKKHELIIGKDSIIRSDTIIYGDCVIGDSFQCGHRVTIRENVNIGKNVRIGTNSDIQDNVIIGSYVNIHSDVFISAKNVIKDYVWIFPRVLFTNDPNPPSNDLIGSIVESFSAIGAGSIILPGSHIEGNSLIGAGTVVRGKIKSNGVYVGNPCRRVKNIEDIKSKVTGEDVYPWRDKYDRGMPWENIGFDVWMNKSEI